MIKPPTEVPEAKQEAEKQRRKKVIKNLATFLPKLLKLEKLNEHDIVNKKQLATILRAMPTLI